MAGGGHGLAISCLAFAISYSPRTQVAGAVSVPVVFDNGTDLVIAAAPADLPPEAYRPSLEQVASNLKGSGRTSPDGLVHVRLRRVDSVEPGLSRPVVLAEAAWPAGGGRGAAPPEWPEGACGLGAALVSAVKFMSAHACHALYESVA